jgi:hypothetical protein
MGFLGLRVFKVCGLGFGFIRVWVSGVFRLGFLGLCFFTHPL